MDSSDSEDTDKIQRLGLCEVCNANEAKYTCPKCEIKSCCLKCLNIHKKELSCDGSRDRTKFVPLKNMTKMEMMSDYYFLEECTRFVDDRKRDKSKKFTRYNKELPSCLYKLRCAAAERKTTLRFLLQNFTKSQKNTTFLDFKEKIIYWRLEWCFPNAENLIFFDDKCDENEKLFALLNKYLDPNSDADYPGKKNLEFYQSRGINGIKVLLKSEGIKKCKNRFFELDHKKTLKENLLGKTVVEYPSIYVIFADCDKAFDVIDSDEDVDYETMVYEKELNDLYRPKDERPRVKIEVDVHENMEKLAIERKRDERKKKREAQKIEPQNLLFMDENMWNEMSSDSDSGQETEEEEVTSPKQCKANLMV